MIRAARYLATTVGGVFAFIGITLLIWGSGELLDGGPEHRARYSGDV